MNKLRSLIWIFVITLTLTTCSATIGSNATSQFSTPTLYLPVVTNNYPDRSIIGVDGNSYLQQIANTGVRFLRLNTQLWWSDIESTKGRYDWDKAARVEELIMEASANRLDVILLMQTAPVWAREYPGSLCGPIKDEELDAFAAFVGEAVRRYSVPPFNVKYYQIWNEPDQFVKETDSGNNNGCWAESTNDYSGNRYGEMLTKVYPILKNINPNAQLLIGSLMMTCDPRDPNPQDYCAETNWRSSANFFEGILQEAKESFDIVMFNSGPSFVAGQNPVWTEMNNWRWKVERGGLVNGKINYLRDLMLKYGVNKPIIHSEAYLLDRPEAPDDYESFEDYKADYLVWVYANGWSQDLKAVTWYSIEGWKGSELIRRDGSETKALQALKTMTGFLHQAQFLSRDDNIGYTRFIFRKGNELTWLLIPTGQQYGMEYSIPIPSKFKKAIDLFGNEQAVTDTIRFSRPTYVFLNQ
ncbi:cellulase [Bellilinea caldifistulae]|uniref:Glycoside hydrolase family 5 domain-containing protein n=1 Tax=Bellilinea caldifistulae TaxID=360411 RepID=A0A0N8GNB1_9CHLR|nr:hypothetical protein [Bellilinea caldifistulae]KPL77602.1 hypothetical protein AC812_03480 [Bellilinea caldifistulae]GAP09600.1 cellulase [Bellilinea caldifistulae]